MSLYQQFKTEIVKKMKEELKLDNIHQVPRIDKVVVSMGIGSLVTRKGLKEFADFENHLAKITGQKAHLIKSKKSISNFKLREDMPVMLKTTLRGQKAYDFLERLIKLVFPRVRDFQWVSARQFDSQANLSIGFKQYDIFPEIGPDDMKTPLWLQVTIVTTTQDKTESQTLLKALGMIFHK